MVGPRGAPRTCTLGRGTHPTHSIDLGGGGTLQATLPPDSAPISSTLDLPFPAGEVGKSAWTQSPLRGSTQHSLNEKLKINGNKYAPMPWHALEVLPQCGNIRSILPLVNEITEFVGKSACPVGLPRAIQRCSQLIHTHGQLNEYWEHSYRPFPSRKPSFSLIIRMFFFFFFFFFSLFDTRLDHQRAKCSKYPNYNHKHRTNPFNIAGSAQPRFINAFGISKTNILLMRRRQPIKVAKPSLFFLTS